MRLDQLKPRHGWRVFAGEVGIIVLGVLIALGAQELVEDYNDRQRIAQLRGAIELELANVRARWEDMRAGDRCALQRLDAIERWLETAPAGARVDRGFPLLLWTMNSSAWETAKSSPAGSQVPLQKRLAVADLYSAIDNWREMLAEERVNAVDLSALLASANEPENRRRIALHAARARTYIRRRIDNYPFLFTRFDDLDIAADPSRLDIARDPRALCAPLDGS
jgi:hypothetical protein